MFTRFLFTNICKRTFCKRILVYKNSVYKFLRIELPVLHQYLHHRFPGLWDFADFSQWLVAFEGNYSPSAELVPLKAEHLTTQKLFLPTKNL